MSHKSFEDADKLITTKEILNILPHRYPFLLVDQVRIGEAGKWGYGIKNVTINEPYFQGHFPNEPIVPGVLIIESCAQAVAVVYNSVHLEDIKEENLKDRVGYLGAVNMKFLSIVRPGDVMKIYVELVQKVQNISSFDVEVMVEKKVVAKGSMKVTEK